MKASAFRRWPVTLGLIALVQTTRLKGGFDLRHTIYNRLIHIGF